MILAGLFTSCDDDDDKDPDNTDGVTRISSDRTFATGEIQTLDGFWVVESGATLTIEPGAILKFGDGQGENASALIILPGGKINAVGTPANPIIMTSIQDNIEIGQKRGTNLDGTNNGLWGGFIVLGNAPISASEGAIDIIEGIPAALNLGNYGGTNAAENSGNIQYVSIRHNGIILEADNELQGLTLGGVGSGTTINHIEVIASKDDGIEIFGGAVNLSDLVVYRQGDDGLDLDQAYSGTINNALILVEGGTDGNAAFEFDGPELVGTNDGGTFTVRNVTCKALNGAANGAMILKSRAQGTISNCSFEGFTNWVSINGSGGDNYLNGSLEFTGDIELVGATLDSTLFFDDEDTSTVINAFLADPIVSTPATATVGATVSEFTGWTWVDDAGLLQ